MPRWSPTGQKIVYASFDKSDKRFDLFTMDENGKNHERLTLNSGNNEGPTWSPNGRVLMYFRQKPSKSDGSGGSFSLWSIDLTGFNERMLITPLDASDPAWSPLSSVQ